MIRGLFLSASALLLSAAPAVAVESGAPPPLKIASCIVAADTPNTPLRPGVTMTNGVAVTVTNTSTKAISEIVLSGAYNGTPVTDSYKQELPAGATVTLRRSHPKFLYSGPTPESCFVKHVTFSDGTSWNMTPHTM